MNPLITFIGDDDDLSLHKCLIVNAVMESFYKNAAVPKLTVRFKSHTVPRIRMDDCIDI